MAAITVTGSIDQKLASGNTPKGSTSSQMYLHIDQIRTMKAQSLVVVWEVCSCDRILLRNADKG